MRPKKQAVGTALVSVGQIKITPFLSLGDAVDYIIHENEITPGFAVAINAEKVISAQNDTAVMDAINNATLRYADGIAVVWTIKQKGVANARIPGCDLWHALMQKAGQKNIPVFIIGAKPAVNSKTAEKLKNEFRVNLVGAVNGYFKDQSEVIEQIAASGAKIVSVAMGSPSQEEFINACRKVYPAAFYMGVGGTYDVFVGNIKRAPKWMQRMHLEWLYRLFKQPMRIFRQYKLIKYFSLHCQRKL